jgi:hypothetical protein
VGVQDHAMGTRGEGALAPLAPTKTPKNKDTREHGSVACQQ